MNWETYTWEHLLVVLQQANRAKAELLLKCRHLSDHGKSSLGLKLHCLTPGYPELKPLVDAVGGFAQRPYQKEDASITYVLPPVGSAYLAILLIECIEEFTGHKIFNNPNMQIQVCSPCRLDADNAAFLAVGFYLGSDVLQRYTLANLATTFSNSAVYDKTIRGRRIVLYDAMGDLDRKFEWWDLATIGSTSTLKVFKKLPFKTERTDILTATSRVDIRNINLLMTLLSHYQQIAYWEHLGTALRQDMEAVLREHLLDAVLTVPWVHEDSAAPADDNPFMFAFNELMDYAFAEKKRIKKERATFWRVRSGPPSILNQMSSLLAGYHKRLVDQATELVRGGGL